MVKKNYKNIQNFSALWTESILDIENKSWVSQSSRVHLIFLQSEEVYKYKALE